MPLVRFALLFLAGIVAMPVQAELIGIGLDFRRGIFIQEYWQDGKPFYAIANLNKNGIQISATDWKSGAMLAGPWPIQSQSVGQFDVSKLGGNALMKLTLADGSSLGILGPPVPPAQVVKGVITTYDGMNGSGGRQLELWCEQDKTAYKSGEIIELRLKVPSGAGEIKYNTKPEKSFLPQIVPEEVVCETLPVKKVGNEIQILASKPLKAEKLHAVTLRFRAPAVETPTIVMTSGWRAISKSGGHGITRGIVINP